MQKYDLDRLMKLDPCQEALDWINNNPTLTASLSDAWDNCPRGDWMWWILKNLKLATKLDSILFSRACSMRVMHLRNSNIDAAAYADYADYAAYSADYAAYSAYAADYAAIAYDAAIAIAIAARLQERKFQADFLRKLMVNPFLFLK